MTLKEKLAKISTPKVRTLQDGRVSSVEELWDRVVLPYLPDREIMLKWHKLLMDYADSEMPTFAIRAYYSAPREEYGTLRRGFLTSTPHYKFFYTDNYFAAYFLKMSMDGYVPSLEEFKEMMDDRTFPLRFGPITTPEKEMMSFKQGNDPGIHKAGFKVAHIIPVGKDYDTGAEVVNLTKIMNRYFPRGAREDYLMKAGDGEDHYERYLDADADAKRMIIAHFMRFVHPMNYFACPNDRNAVSDNCKRLAEYQPLLDHAHDYLYDIYGDAYVEFAKRAMALPKYRTPHIGSGDNAIDVTYGLNINGAETKFINECKELICSVVRILSKDMDRGADIINSLTDEQQSNLMFGISGPLLTLEPFAWKAKYSAFPIVDGYYMYDDWGLAEIGQALDKCHEFLERRKGNYVDISEL